MFGATVALEEFDPKDPTSVPVAPRKRAESAIAELLARTSSSDAERPLKGVRIGVPAVRRRRFLTTWNHQARS